MATATGQAPLIKVQTHRNPAVAAGADAHLAAFRAPFTGTITSVTFAPDATLTGANTESRTLSVINETASKTPASLAFVNTVNATAYQEKTITLSGTATDLDVTEGDIISCKSLHVGSTGLADPGGLFIVTFSRS